MSASKTSRLQTNMANLSVSTSSSQRPNASNPTSKKTQAPVIESWDEEEDDDEDDNDHAMSSSDTETETGGINTPPTGSKIRHKRNPSDYPDAPPPTPSAMSPVVSSNEFAKGKNARSTMIDSASDVSYHPSYDFRNTGSSGLTSEDHEQKRPEKSTAVASRLIAAGLGVKAPKRTEEQKEYEKAVRAQERKKKEKEIADRKKAELDRERAKEAMWEG